MADLIYDITDPAQRDADAFTFLTCGGRSITPSLILDAFAGATER